MNRSDLIRATANTHEISIAEAEKTINQILEMITISLACGESVLISGFGKFEIRTKQACVRRNPQNGEEILVPQKNAVLFHASTALKKRVNK